MDMLESLNPDSKVTGRRSANLPFAGTPPLERLAGRPGSESASPEPPSIIKLSKIPHSSYSLTTYRERCRGHVPWRRD